MKLTLKLLDESGTNELGELLAEHCPTRCVLALDGTLGAGKTRLTQAIAVASAIDRAEVTSPTFNLWQTYHGSRIIHHLDAYRINDEDEFYALGVEECFEQDAMTIVEWANRNLDCLPTDERLNIRIEVVDKDQREIFVEGDSEFFADLERALERWAV